jgi:tRNA pseudouridine(38-40) synthase
MPTWKLEVEYEGTRYRGWQIQHNAKSIQGEMQDAARQLFTAKPEIYGSGRTDAGVHAVARSSISKFPICKRTSRRDRSSTASTISCLMTSTS